MPMMTIPSVEPISERSFGCGVEVDCVTKNAVAPKRSLHGGWRGIGEGCAEQGKEEAQVQW